MNHVYHFLTHWRVEATCGEVADVLGDPRDLVRWWPSVYLAVEETRPPDAHGLGRRVRLHTKGWLPYTLRWEFEVVESRYPYGLTLVANGDFEGRGVWTFRQNGRFVEIDYDWRISAEKPLLRSLSFLLKPLFEANHRWAMARGEESLQLELVRRRAVSNAVRAEVPPPPGPVTYAGVVLIAAVVGAAASAAWLIAKAAGRRTGRAGE
ncbi:MAG TPA: SRPBCC family protein [Vicinamibacterales bacterium]|nr:SRPBCC family protein [Vicinamibacterales bacterium]